MTSLDLSKLSIEELKKIDKKENKVFKKNIKEYRNREKQKLIDKIVGRREQNIKIEKVLSKSSKPKPKPKPKKIKSFEDYFQECIKNKSIPKDTPKYLRKALERAIKEYQQGVVLQKSALDNFAEKFVIEGKPGILPKKFLQEKAQKVKRFFKTNRDSKIKMVLVCMMEQKIEEKKLSITAQAKGYFHSSTQINIASTDEKKIISKMFVGMLQGIRNYQINGSGWYFKEVLQLEIHKVDYKPMKGSSYIPLPVFIKNKKAIIYIENKKDNKCFQWCILRYLHPRERDKERITDLKQYENELNFTNIDFPVKLRDIDKFQKQNPNLPGISVFSVNENNSIYPLLINKKDCQDTIKLFLIERDGNYHYSLISNFSRLVNSQISKDTNMKKFICERCLSHFVSEEKYKTHFQYCSNNESAKVKMPPQNTKLYFKNHFKKLPVPFVVYADFDCFTMPINTCKPYPNDSFTMQYQKHEPSGFCLYLKGPDGLNTFFDPIIYTKQKEDEDISQIFFKKIEALTRQIYNKYYKNPKPMKMTEEDDQNFNSSTICHICEKDLGKDRVRDHCHFTGKYRGAAHKSCNLQCRRPMLLPVIFHNLQGYDAHLFIKQLSKVKGELNCIPTTEEKYISFSKKIEVDEYFSKKRNQQIKLNFEIRFIDSFKFLQTSLANLVSNLQQDDLINTKKIIKNNVELLSKKGVYPYDYVSSISKFSETQLPPKSEFYSKLNDENISDEDYQHAQYVWETFSCKTIKDYHDLYLKSDVLLLADVFENFRKTSLQHYQLDPCHYYTSPGLAWDACLKETKQELQLLHDYDMLMMFEKGIRGGITHISKRYSEANNKYMENYDPNKPSKFITYLDANNLYGWAMSKKLPTHGFKWVKDISTEKVLNLLEKRITNRGYIFEVDLVYPKEFWDSHNDYPLAPEKMKVDNVEKLVCTFLPKTRYVLHYKNLRQYISLGMKLKKVYRGITFYQSVWMKPYI